MVSMVSHPYDFTQTGPGSYNLHHITLITRDAVLSLPIRAMTPLAQIILSITLFGRKLVRMCNTTKV